MPTHVALVKSNEDLARYREECQDWKLVSNANPLSKQPHHVLIDDSGRIVTRYYRGRVYDLVDKFEKEYGLIERVARACLGILATLATGGIALFSATVRGLFSDTKVTLITVVEPEEGRQSGKMNGFDETVVSFENQGPLHDRDIENGMECFRCVLTKRGKVIAANDGSGRECQNTGIPSPVVAMIVVLNPVEIRDVVSRLRREQLKGDFSLFEKAELAWPAPDEPAEFVLENSFDNSILEEEHSSHSPDLSPIQIRMSELYDGTTELMSDDEEEMEFTLGQVAGNVIL
ncbi:hypothetical protein [Estrella lausannensis]|uniref:Uncharacterized protein n=1 Tax=Estrella lausannensis TaxID=483423 RepID=A0A0H5DP42_9BACT|nr:hypothetical protein [Estrella lausannensis]CRX37673.1 Hypothetical protein ELAC_0312 [Estrella lausannensis]